MLLAPLVGSKPVLTSCVGALATDPAFATRLADDLAAYPGAPARLVPAALDPLRGAALLAYEVAGVRTDPDVTDRLALNGSAEVGPPPS